MSTKKSSKPAKPLTLRQKLRLDAEETLDTLNFKGLQYLERLIKDTGIRSPRTLARLIAGGQTGTLRGQCITEIANRKESQLLEMYNQQQELLPVSEDATSPVLDEDKA